MKKLKLQIKWPEDSDNEPIQMKKVSHVIGGYSGLISTERVEGLNAKGEKREGTLIFIWSITPKEIGESLRRRC